MKKLVTLLLALTMVLSLAACGSKNNAPQQGESGGGAAVHDPLEGAGEGQAAAGTDAVATSSTIPGKAPAYKEYNYTYLGLSIVLPDELRDMLKSGEAWTYYNVQWKTEGKDYDYVRKFFCLAEKDNFAKEEFTSPEEYETWLATTKLFGAITVVKSEYLKDNKIEDITKCEENEEIGKSSDGKYVFYFSTNEVEKVTDLFKQAKVTTTDPTEIPKNACAFIYDGPHKE